MRSSSVRFFKFTKTAHTIAVNGDLLTFKNDLKVGAAENSPAIQSQTATVTVEVRSKLFKHFRFEERFTHLRLTFAVRSKNQTCETSVRP